MKISITLLVLCFLSATAQAESAPAEPPRPKFGPQAQRLFLDQAYVRKNKAPDFWAMASYYLHQETGSSCSIASTAMVVNAARVTRPLTAADELATHKGILAKSKDARWLSGDGVVGDGVNLDQLGELLEKSLKSYDIPKAKVRVVHFAKNTPQFKKQLIAVLQKNEKSAHDFLVVNFLQSEYTGDPEGAVGHIAPVAAYDAKRSRVLIFDPDRAYYEPYWVSVETLIKGMNTMDSGGKMFRGYVYVTTQ